MHRHLLGFVGFCVAAALSSGLAMLAGTLGSGGVSTSDSQTIDSGAAATCATAVAGGRRRPRGNTAPSITFDAHVIALGADDPSREGSIWPCQRVRYGVIRVLAGEYDASDIVVDHRIGDGDAFGGLEVGDRVRVTAELQYTHRHYNGRLAELGVDLTPPVLFVADERPHELAHEDFVTVTPPN